MDGKQTRNQRVHRAHVGCSQAQKKTDRGHGMFWCEVLERYPFCNVLQVAVEAEGKQEACMTVVEVLPRFVVEDPRRINTLGLRRDGETSCDALVKETPTDFLFREL